MGDHQSDDSLLAGVRHKVSEDRQRPYELSQVSRIGDPELERIIQALFLCYC
jgi:hypothetical protein